MSDPSGLGEPVEPKCPKCRGQCVYNGNYFCTDRDGCGWALQVMEDGSHGYDEIWFHEALDSLWRYRASKGHEDPFHRNPYMPDFIRPEERD